MAKTHFCPNGHWIGDMEADLPDGKCNVCGEELVAIKDEKPAPTNAELADAVDDLYQKVSNLTAWIVKLETAEPATDSPPKTDPAK